MKDEIEVRMIPVGQIAVESTGGRFMADADCKARQSELEASIAEKGIIVPLLMRAEMRGDDVLGYVLIAGHRRFTAAAALKLAQVPCRVVKAETPAEVQELQLLENLQRADLHPMEEAEALAALGKALGTGDMREIARKVGKAYRHVAVVMSLLNLIPAARKAYQTGRMDWASARRLARMSGHDQKTLFDDSRGGAIDDWAAKRFMLDLARAAFDVKETDYRGPKDVVLPPCDKCGKTTRDRPELFEDFQPKEVRCTDSVCWKQKEAAVAALALAQAQAKSPDAVPISLVSYNEQQRRDLPTGTLSEGKFRIVEHGECEDTKTGIVVAAQERGYGHDGPQVGATVKICTKSGCRHHGAPRSAKAKRAKVPEGQSQPESVGCKENRVKKQNAQTFKAILGVPLVLDGSLQKSGIRHDVALVALSHVVNEIDYRCGKFLALAFGLTTPEKLAAKKEKDRSSVYGGSGWITDIEKHFVGILAKIEEPGEWQQVWHRLLTYAVISQKILWREDRAYDYGSKIDRDTTKMMLSIAAEIGLDLEALAVQADGMTYGVAMLEKRPPATSESKTSSTPAAKPKAVKVPKAVKELKAMKARKAGKKV